MIKMWFHKFPSFISRILTFISELFLTLFLKHFWLKSQRDFLLFFKNYFFSCVLIICSFSSVLMLNHGLFILWLVLLQLYFLPYSDNLIPILSFWITALHVCPTIRLHLEVSPFMTDSEVVGVEILWNRTN